MVGERFRAIMGGSTSESEANAGDMLSAYQLKRRVDGLDTRMDLAEKNITDLGSRITDAHNSVAAAIDVNNAQQSQIADLISVNNSQQSQINDAIAINNSQADQITKIVGDISAVTGIASGSVKSLGELSGLTDSQQKTINTQESKLTQLRADHDQLKADAALSADVVASNQWLSDGITNVSNKAVTQYKQIWNRINNIVSLNKLKE